MNDTILLPIVSTGLALWALMVAAEAVVKLYWRYRNRRTGGYKHDMECPMCKEISLRYYGEVKLTNGDTMTEYECTECKHYETGEW